MAAYTTIDDPSAYFKVQLYTGDGSTQAITFDDTDTDMQPDLVWLKDRATSTAYESIEVSYKLYDAVRGTTKFLSSNVNGAEGTESGVTAFGSDGFTLGSAAGTNANTVTFVAWCWKESATAGFDIVSYTGNGSARTISHSLSAVPHLIIVKNRDAADSWQVYHGANTAAPETDYLSLDVVTVTTDASDRWNDTAPTSSVFSLGAGAEVNTNTETYIAYAFAPKQGFSKFGTYDGNGNADGPFIYLGFRPAFVLWKNAEYAENWHIIDNERDTYNLANNGLTANENYPASDDANIQMDFLSNGIKIRSASHATSNVSGNYCVYIAFAEAPFVNSNGVPCNAR